MDMSKKCIRKLGIKSMKASKGRNIIAIIAIMLTAILFTTFFTILFSINASVEDANFRQIGTYSHGEFKALSQAQYNEIKDDPRIKEYGLKMGKMRIVKRGCVVYNANQKRRRNHE